MKPWQHNLVIEKALLAKKMDALQDFIENSTVHTNLSMQEQSELNRQLDAMSDYYEVLCTRVNRIEFDSDSG